MSLVKLLIIADDFTGALDTGVQFAEAGTRVRVVTNTDYAYCGGEKEPEVLVMDTESRHLDQEAAYKKVFRVTRDAKNSGIPYIYKKTDSALRGNIGSELTAVLEGADQKVLPFVPAFPRMGRITKNGIQYISGVPVKESVFGADPFEPVIHSYIPDIIHLQSDAVVGTDENQITEYEQAIMVYDACSDKQLADIGEKLYNDQTLAVMAGCAGFASVLPGLLKLERDWIPDIPQLMPGLLVVCGSINPITGRQLDYAEKNGFLRIRLTPGQKLNEMYWDTEKGEQTLKNWVSVMQSHPRCILDTNDLSERNETLLHAERCQINVEEIRTRIIRSLGLAIKKMLGYGLSNNLMLTGGDTLLGFMNCMGVSEVQPVCELLPGTVLSVFKNEGKSHWIISKSGGFGKKELLVEILDLMKKKGERSSEKYT